MLRNQLWSSATISRGFRRYASSRTCSNASAYRVFPATLYRFQTSRGSNLYDLAQKQDGSEYEDGVVVSADGNVHAKTTTDVSNGALFMPNTHFMQELTRSSFDDYVAAVDNGQPPDEPHYLRIPKGTPVPCSLALLREQTSRFTLQPERPMSLAALNDTLTRFYSESGHVTDAGKWLDENPYHGGRSR